MRRGGQVCTDGNGARTGWHTTANVLPSILLRVCRHVMCAHFLIFSYEVLLKPGLLKRTLGVTLG